MVDGLEYIRQTIQLNEDILIESDEDTNEMVVEDFLEYLGYDRRRKKNIHKLRNNLADWRIRLADNKDILIKVVALHSNLDEVQCNLDEVYGLIVTDGEKLRFYTNKIADKLLFEINIFDNSDDTNQVISMMRADSNIEGFIEGRIKSNGVSTLYKLIESKDISIFNESLVDTNNIDTIYGLFAKYLSENQSDCESELNDLRAKIESLIAEKQSIVDHYTNIVSSEAAKKDSELNLLKAKYTELQTEYDKIKAGFGSVELDNTEFDSVKAKLAEVESIKSILEVRLVGAENTRSELEVKLANTEAKLTETETKLANTEAKLTETEAKLTETEAKLTETEAKLTETETKLTETETKLANTETKPSTDKLDITDNNDYRSQIERLHIEVSRLNDLIESKDAEIADLKTQIDNKVDPRVLESKGLLDSIEDDPELPRSFVGVVNGNLFQAPNVEKFIGSALQELYQVVTFELMPYLFDGDVFTITDNVVRKDFMIANKFYDLKLDNISESDSIQRLRSLFNKFPSVIFFDKVIGTLREIEEETDDTSDILVDSIEDIGDDLNFESDAFDDSDDSIDENFENHLGISDGSIDENFDEISDDSDILDNGLVLDASSFESDYTKIAFAVCDLGNVLWNTGVNLEYPEYIYYNNRVFKISNESIDRSFIDIVSAILCYSPNIIRSLASIKQFSFINISKLVNTSGDGIQIPHTEFYIRAENIGQTLPIITQFCELCNIQSEEVYIYFNGSISSAEFKDHCIDTKDWELVESDESNYTELGSSEDLGFVLSGSFLRLSNNSDDLFNLESKLIKRSIAIKNKFLTRSLEDTNSLNSTIREILLKSDDPVDVVIAKLDNIPNTNLRFISKNSGDVGSVSGSIQINGSTYYIGETSPYQLVNCMINLHIVSVGDYSVSCKIVLDKNLLYFYKDQFMIYDPVKTANIKYFLTYAFDRLP